MISFCTHITCSSFNCTHITAKLQYTCNPILYNLKYIRFIFSQHISLFTITTLSAYCLYTITSSAEWNALSLRQQGLVYIHSDNNRKLILLRHSHIRYITNPKHDISLLFDILYRRLYFTFIQVHNNPVFQFAHPVIISPWCYPVSHIATHSNPIHNSSHPVRLHLTFQSAYSQYWYFPSCAYTIALLLTRLWFFILHAHQNQMLFVLSNIWWTTQTHELLFTTHCHPHKMQNTRYLISDGIQFTIITACILSKVWCKLYHIHRCLSHCCSHWMLNPNYRISDGLLKPRLSWTPWTHIWWNDKRHNLPTRYYHKSDVSRITAIVSDDQCDLQHHPDWPSDDSRQIAPGRPFNPASLIHRPLYRITDVFTHCTFTHTVVHTK